MKHTVQQVVDELTAIVQTRLVLWYDEEFITVLPSSLRIQDWAGQLILKGEMVGAIVTLHDFAESVERTTFDKTGVKIAFDHFCDFLEWFDIEIGDTLHIPATDELYHAADDAFVATWIKMPKVEVDASLPDGTIKIGNVTVTNVAPTGKIDVNKLPDPEDYIERYGIDLFRSYCHRVNDDLKQIFDFVLNAPSPVPYAVERESKLERWLLNADDYLKAINEEPMIYKSDKS